MLLLGVDWALLFVVGMCLLVERPFFMFVSFFCRGVVCGVRADHDPRQAAAAMQYVLPQNTHQSNRVYFVTQGRAMKVRPEVPVSSPVPPSIPISNDDEYGQCGTLLLLFVPSPRLQHLALLSFVMIRIAVFFFLFCRQGIRPGTRPRCQSTMTQQGRAIGAGWLMALALCPPQPGPRATCPPDPRESSPGTWLTAAQSAPCAVPGPRPRSRSGAVRQRGRWQRAAGSGQRAAGSGQRWATAGAVGRGIGDVPF